MPALMTSAVLPRHPAPNHVWWWELPGRVDPDDEALLGTAERERMRRFRDEPAAAAYARTRAGARRALGALLGVPASEIVLGREACPGCDDPRHGPPRLVHPGTPLAISLSRTAGRGLFAVGTAARVGVDVEALRSCTDAMAELALTDRERAAVRTAPPGEERDRLLLRGWTRKEAVLKAVGTGLVGTRLNRLETHLDDPGPVLISYAHRGRATTWSVADLDVGEGHVAALATPTALTGPAIELHPNTHRDEDPS
jgi:4'-phosphopantetheinyl transferase